MRNQVRYPTELGSTSCQLGQSRAWSFIAEEMVATDRDQNALARVCACNAKGEVLMDRLLGRLGGRGFGVGVGEVGRPGRPRINTLLAY